MPTCAASVESSTTAATVKPTAIESTVVTPRIESSMMTHVAGGPGVSGSVNRTAGIDRHDTRSACPPAGAHRRNEGKDAESHESACDEDLEYHLGYGTVGWRRAERT
jgi:hypothetical protein